MILCDSEISADYNRLILDIQQSTGKYIDEKIVDIKQIKIYAEKILKYEKITAIMSITLFVSYFLISIIILLLSFIYSPIKRLRNNIMKILRILSHENPSLPLALN
jgi:hypothetical protein